MHVHPLWLQVSYDSVPDALSRGMLPLRFLATEEESLAFLEGIDLTVRVRDDVALDGLLAG